jgi:hypothetical protein
MQSISRLLVGGALACGLAACSVTSPSDLTSQTFSDSVAPGSQSSQFQFSTSKTGEFIVKIATITPDSGATLVVEYGTSSVVAGVAGCSVISAVPAGQGKAALDIQLPKGDYCLFMADPNSSLPRTESFTATVSHL